MSSSKNVGDAFLSDLEVRRRVVREVICAAALDQPTTNDVVFGRVVVALDHDPRRDALEQVLTEERLRLGWSKVANPVLAVLRPWGLVLDELTLARLHAIC